MLDINESSNEIKNLIQNENCWEQNVFLEDDVKEASLGGRQAVERL